MQKFILVLLVASFGLLPMPSHAQTTNECYALNGSLQQSLPIYRAPSLQATEIDHLGIREYRLVAHINPTWTLVFNVEGDISGWLATENLIFGDMCSTGWQLATPLESEILPQTDDVTILYPRVNLRAEPTTSSVQVGQAEKDDTLTVIGQASTNAGVWYLAEHDALGLVWVRSDLVSVPFNKSNLLVIETDYVNALAPQVVTNSVPVEASSSTTTTSASANPPPSTSAPQTTNNNSVETGSWQHVSTLDEHGCNTGGSPIGTQTTLNLHISQAADNSSVTLTYDATGYQFTLPLAWQRAGTWVYVGSYNQGKVKVQVTFNSATTYFGNEVVTHDSGCIVKSSWVGYKLQ